MNINYPIKFRPILKNKIWGGGKLKTLLNKSLKNNNTGESWELSGLKGDISIVTNGNLKGENLSDLIRKYKSNLLGKKVYEFYGEEFPLLFKFIDAAEDLSIQLHPNDILAKQRHNSFGKTEMWYVLDADLNSELYIGFKENVNKDAYVDVLSNQGDLLELIHKKEVSKGEAFFIEAGTIHAIGKGTVIAEIQQTSDITYRIFDWDRIDELGEKRELHTELSIEALEFSNSKKCKIDYSDKKNKLNQIYSCDYFTTNKLNVENEMNRDLAQIDSFVVYMCVEGSVQISLNENIEMMKKGDTVLIPANANSVCFTSKVNGSLLEVYI